MINCTVRIINIDFFANWWVHLAHAICSSEGRPTSCRAKAISLPCTQPAQAAKLGKSRIPANHWPESQRWLIHWQTTRIYNSWPVDGVFYPRQCTTTPESWQTWTSPLTIHSLARGWSQPPNGMTLYHPMTSAWRRLLCSNKFRFHEKNSLRCKFRLFHHWLDEFHHHPVIETRCKFYRQTKIARSGSLSFVHDFCRENYIVQSMVPTIVTNNSAELFTVHC